MHKSEHKSEHIVDHDSDMNLDVNKAYISPYDIFLRKFDKTHEKSASQLAEIKKFEHIFALRDNPNADLSHDVELAFAQQIEGIE